MKTFASIVGAVVASISLSSIAAPPATAPATAPVKPVVDDYFGVKVTDPYRYMEDLTDPQVQAWIKSQADYAKATLEALPGRDALVRDIEKYTNAVPARVSSVHRAPNDTFYFLKTPADANLANLYVRHGLSGKDELLIDADQFKGPKGEPVSIAAYSVSFDGRYIAFEIALAGAEIGDVHVLDTTTGKETGEHIDRIWGAHLRWRPDNQSFFYHRLNSKDTKDPDLELNSKSYLHTVGNLKDEDTPVFGAGLSDRVVTDPIDWPEVTTQFGSDYVVGSLEHGTRNEKAFYAAPLVSLGEKNTPWTKLCDVDDDITDFTFHGNDVYLLSFKDAERYKIIHTKLDHPDLAKAEVILPPQPGVLRDFAAAADALYVDELDRGVHHIIRVPYDGSGPQRLKLPFEGNAAIASADTRIPGVVLSLASWTKATKFYLYDPKSDAIQPTDLQPSGPYDDREDLTSIEVEAISYDGTRVPLSIAMKKNLPLDGSNPTIVNSYGAYGITSDPGLNPANLAWFDRGGIIAFAHPRGGGECGEQWHLAGYKLTKPNTWRDTIACARYLLDKHYTSTANLGVIGGSAGGVTAGRAITERPDLFAAACIRAGCVNTLRMEAYPNGAPNTPEFGSAKTQEGFEDLYTMDAYHHLRDGVEYPACLLTVGMNDPRVTPWMPSKFAARMQAATASNKPVLLRVDYNNGHFGGVSKRQSIETSADVFAFFLSRFQHPSQ